MTDAQIVLAAMKNRRSIRKFRPELPAEDVVKPLIESGLYAASGRGHQAAIILEIRDRQIRDRLSIENCRIGGWPAGFDPFYGAPLLLAVLAEENWPTRVYDGSLVMGNLMLAASVVGLASCWIHRAKETFALPEWRDYLRRRGVAGDYEGIGFCALGYCAENDLPEMAPRREGRYFPDMVEAIER